MVAPSGVCGVHSWPYAGHWMRLLQAPQNLPADAHLRLRGLQTIHLEQTLGVVVSVFAESVAARRDRADAAPFAIAHFEDLVDQLFRRGIAVALNDPAILNLDLGPALFSCCDDAQHAFEHVDRLEAGDDDRHLETPAQWDHIGRPITVHTWPGPMKPCTRLPGAARWPRWRAAPGHAKRAC